jgi:predicted nucleotide-binding protein
MAKTIPQPALYANITVAQLPGAITKLKRRLDSIFAVPAPVDPDEIGLRAQAICDRSNETYREIFGPDSLQAREARVITTGFYDLNADDWREELKAFEDARKRTAGRLETTIALLEEKLSDIDQAASSASSDVPTVADPASGPVFLVHGHDSLAKNEVTLLLERAGLEVTILHEQPNGGRTVMEKFEGHAGAAAFAVVILTPDDVGGPVGGQMMPRARQNVVGEMFWFAGKLGRKRVCVLRKGDVEIPSDFAGLVYTDIDDRGAWKQELLRELQNARYVLDWPRALA